MNRILFAVLAWVALGLETGLRPAFAVGDGRISPSLVLPVAVYIALFATPLAATWGCLILGVLLDLTSGRAVVGPYALAYLLLAQTVIQARGVMMRRNPIVLVLLSVLGGIIVSIVVVAVLTFRALVYGQPAGWHGGAELGVRLLGALYTGLVGFVMALVLLPMTELFGFPQEVRRFARRS